jgi:tetratricopeptide (TPR) repeat protein
VGLAKDEKADCLREYGKALFAQYNVSKEKGGSLDEAIKMYKDAIELMDDNNHAIVDCLNDLANATLDKFENDGRPNDADQAIHYYLEAITRLERFPLIKVEKPRYFIGLGNAFFIKFEMWDQIADLNQAIYYYQEAVDHTLDPEASLPNRIGSLSRALLRKFQITRDNNYLIAAQDYIQSALDRQPPPSPQSLAALQNSMGISYLHAFDASNKDITFLDKAASCFQAAIDTGCTQPFVKHPPIINLSRSLMGKYQYTKNDDDLNKAVVQMPLLISLLQNGRNINFRGALDTIGTFCALVYDIKKWEEIARIGSTCYKLLAKQPSAIPGQRMFAALQASRLSFEVMHDARSASDILASVIKILPEAILIGPNRADHLRAAKLLSPYPSYFLSFSLAAGDSPAESLIGFEQTRCILWNRLFDLNTDITHLKEKHEDLALKFDRLRMTISRLQPQTVVSDSTAPNRFD